MTQEQFDPSRDNADLMIADYYDGTVEPVLPELEETPVISDLEITYSGRPVVRAGGGFKKFTLKANVNGELIYASPSEEYDIKWDVSFPDGDLSKLEYTYDGNIFTIKCLNDYSLIGKTFIVTAQTQNSSKSIVVEVGSL